MDDDRSWLKNPTLPRPPAVPHFSAAELSLVEDERPSSIARVAVRKARASRIQSRRRVSGASRARSEAAQVRRIAWRWWVGASCWRSKGRAAPAARGERLSFAHARTGRWAARAEARGKHAPVRSAFVGLHLIRWSWSVPPRLFARFGSEHATELPSARPARSVRRYARTEKRTSAVFGAFVTAPRKWAKLVRLTAQFVSNGQAT